MDWLEQQCAIGLRDADALVVARRRQRARRGGGSNGDRRIWRRVLERVGDQIFKHLPDTRRIDLERRQAVGHGSQQAMGPDLSRSGHPANARPARQGRRGALENKRIRLQMRDVQNLLDQCGEALGRMVDTFQVLSFS
ncbi:MAG TPA: hypothetical protein VGQ62_24975 [Chloroflexota bacterium]|jgi:hypothetical protein|nr:hypothetical protein [Chloroflexota bacterium]